MFCSHFGCVSDYCYAQPRYILSPPGSNGACMALVASCISRELFCPEQTLLDSRVFGSFSAQKVRSGVLFVHGGRSGREHISVTEAKWSVLHEQLIPLLTLN
jgi:hypothetical protein